LKAFFLFGQQFTSIVRSGSPGLGNLSWKVNRAGEPIPKSAQLEHITTRKSARLNPPGNVGPILKTIARSAGSLRELFRKVSDRDRTIHTSRTTHFTRYGVEAPGFPQPQNLSR
jgi:hypothetical protein